ncbi:thiol-disulfide oxidoreductase DCC family protein [Alkalicoccobacillus porphyridii]|uniref:DUF393 domain-containing protein n=1 Tax=Alkalicoccobacillus porphyridii TaxID=2597270 RepID=A0A553ZVN3_9BACI|nr:DUF393 domain-containing protein [Alkalicoccobacillus porphyridii]TSB45529.1 DUF393 domain-containing protein [Alkalicoccobacillus porphyridii]
MSSKHLILFDAECPLCQSIKTFVTKMDWLNRLEWYPLQEIHHTKYRFLKNRNIYDEIHMITANNEIKTGFYTVRKILLNLPLTAGIGLILFIPFIDKLGVSLYQFISTNRYEWFGRLEDYPSY